MERPQKIIQPGDYCNDFARIDDGLLWETYCGNNYEVEHTPRNPEGKKVAAVYFSDNCLYDIAENNFYQRVIVENHFDWKNNMLKNADLHIFVRDIFLKAYFYGINNRVDNIEKLADFLKGLTAGYDEVVMLGSCAGGYAASLIGSMLKVSRILCFSGQFNPPQLGLPNKMSGKFGVMDMEEMVEGEELEKRNQYRSIAEYVREGNVPLYYFVGSGCPADTEDCRVAMSLPNVRVFRFNNAVHGMPVDRKCLADLINMDGSGLECLYAQFRGRIFGHNEFGFSASGLKYLLTMLANFFKKFKS
jgi:hypothetical protein